MNPKHPLFSVPNRKTTPVIASFDAQGNVRPLYIRIDSFDFEILSCRVTKTMIEFIEFECRIEDHGRLKKIKLFLSLSAHVWFIDYSGENMF